MLPQHVRTDDRYSFEIDDADLRRIRLVVDGAPTAALWTLRLESERVALGMFSWLVARLRYWQVWGRLAEHIGATAFEAHIFDLTQLDPPGDLVGSMVLRTTDPRAIKIGILNRVGSEERFTPFVHHVFGSRVALETFLAWLETQRQRHVVADYIEFALNNGTAAMSRKLNRDADRLVESPLRHPRD